MKMSHLWKWAGDPNQIPENYKCECGQVEYKDRPKENIESDEIERSL